MYDKDLKYITISYRWGELNEQLLKTPDYTAHITSFDLKDLKHLCRFIKKERDLKEIPYLWVDAISVNQHNHERKKETILLMADIYKRATYILAVPDLHLSYLKKNSANRYAIQLVTQHKETIYDFILHQNRNLSTKAKIKQELEINEGIRTAYEFLEYLMDDWSNRAWVVSEYSIAKEKQQKKGTPLKYIFMSLLNGTLIGLDVCFFSFSFKDDDDDDDHEDVGYDDLFFTTMNNLYQDQQQKKSILLLKEKLTQRSHLEMLLNSNASRNEDRFNAILPSWVQYKHLIKNKNTISEWMISDMTSVRLKLLEIIDDVWEKAKIVKACTQHGTLLRPSFASHYNANYLHIFEKEDKQYAFKIYTNTLLRHIFKKNRRNKNDEEYVTMKNISYDETANLLYTDNITRIQLNRRHQQCYLSISAKKYFIIKAEHRYLQKYISAHPLGDDDDDNQLICVYVPFFTFKMSKFMNVPIPDGSCVYLLGNIDKNKWIIIQNCPLLYYRFSPCSVGYTFNIY